MNNTQFLIEALKENPDRELIFMYPEEGSDHPFTLGYPSKVLIDEYVTIDERVWLRNEDEDELFDDISSIIADDLYYGASPITTEQEVEIKEKTEKHIKELKWKKAIVVYIKP